MVSKRDEYQASKDLRSKHWHLRHVPTGVLIAVGAVALSAIIIVWWLFVSEYTPLYKLLHLPSNSVEAGQWGDKFGGINSLFTALGTIGVIATLLLQIKFIQDQRLDAHRERVEAQLFELMKIMREMRSDVRFSFSAEVLRAERQRLNLQKNAKNSKRGLDAFKAMLVEYDYWSDKHNQEAYFLSEGAAAAIFFRKIHRRARNFYHYMRMIHNIFHRIDSDPHLTPLQKIELSRTVRGNLTNDEATIVGLNSLTNVSGNFYAYTCRYRLLKYASYKALLRDHFPPETFEGRQSKHDF